METAAGSSTGEHREIVCAGWLQLKEAPKGKWKKGRYGRESWVVLCVHDGRVPLLEWYAHRELASGHEPTSVVDLLDVARVTRSIDVHRGFNVHFGADRPALHFGAVYDDDCDSWMSHLTRRLRELGQLTADVGNDYEAYTPSASTPPLYTPINRANTAPSAQRQQSTWSSTDGTHRRSAAEATIGAPMSSLTADDDVYDYPPMGSPSRHSPLDVVPPAPEFVPSAAPMTTAMAAEFDEMRVSPRGRAQHSPRATTLPTTESFNKTLSLKEREMMRLYREIESTEGVEVLMSYDDLATHLGCVEMGAHVWVYGWSASRAKEMSRKLHVGDAIHSIDGRLIARVDDMQTAFFDTDRLPGATLSVIVRRLPHGRLFSLRRPDGDTTETGITCHAKRNTIERVEAMSAAYTADMTPKCESYRNPSTLCHWAITEINGRPLSLIAKDGDAQQRLKVVGQDISILVQPEDFVKDLFKHVKKCKHYKNMAI